MPAPAPSHPAPPRPTKPCPTLAEQAPPPDSLPEIARRLAERYLPTPPVPRRAAEPTDGLIGTILSQQNTAAITRRQFDALKAAYPIWEAALADGPDGIEAVLKAAGGGLSRVKSHYIFQVLERLENTRGTLSLKDTREMDDAQVRALLESLPGVGMKTASCVLLFDLARPAMPVDTHIWRISRRLELTPGTWNAVKVEKWFDEVLPRTWQARYTFHVAAIRHGRETCKAQRPRCEACVLSGLCPSAGIFLNEAVNKAASGRRSRKQKAE
ncbi:endonuclease III [Deinococcus rubellus]|uniref:Endonuclease III n=1 Tax=Deinococcus rubellus TaxID=1889240 RepID=A0ABY5YHL2_9DEIO|nr:endonuclease III [Deinococcus rubellus]UWX63293.1 endonuclease III [Deinococcus rubellus]